MNTAVNIYIGTSLVLVTTGVLGILVLSLVQTSTNIPTMVFFVGIAMLMIPILLGGISSRRKQK